MTKEEILIKHYGIQNLKPKQEEIINSILLHQDTIGILPTGYGKSITYQLPALLFEGMTLVIDGQYRSLCPGRLEQRQCGIRFRHGRPERIGGT